MTNIADRNSASIAADRQALLLRALAQQVAKLRRRKLALFTLNSGLFSAAGFAMLGMVSSAKITLILFSCVLAGGFFWWQYYRGSFQKLTSANLLEHFNRQFSDYEESAQLLLKKPSELSWLTQLQQKKLFDQLDIDRISGRLKDHQPPIDWQFTLSLAALAAVLIVVKIWLIPAFDVSVASGLAKPPPKTDKPVRATPKLLGAKVAIVPPAYTHKATSHTEDLNLTVLQGAEINWHFEFSDPNVDYFFIQGADTELPLRLHEQKDKIDSTDLAPSQSMQTHVAQLALQIEQSALYRLVYKDNSGTHSLPGIFSIAVVKDQPPKIKLIEPLTSLVEFSHSADPSFVVEAVVSDDYGVSDVSILASVAKGSGEAVKFRDQKFLFDETQASSEGDRYRKQWRLSELEMAPGDEVYFSVWATDNRTPEVQRSKSSSVIVRWLDEEPTTLAAEGLQIRFTPEYFRSQRQIIIETEQLIADKKDLTESDLQQISTDLGNAQRHLKEKYGQYLGDEFGEGPGEQFGLADGYHGGEDHADGEASAGMTTDDSKDQDTTKNHEQHHAAATEIGHLHEEQGGQKDKSGASELIARFGHNHGAVEIAPLSSRDPKSWMKKAVSTMWQAELYLMLSEPEKALPFEYEAYRYLKIARQAEKIYVKRLGFEPPPVSESNRLSGELDEIKNRHWQVDEALVQETTQSLYAKAYHYLSYWRADKPIEADFTLLLQNLSGRLLELAESRPVLLKQAATVEKLIVEQSIQLSDCTNCVVQLRQKLWQLIENIDSLPLTRASIPPQDPQALLLFVRSQQTLVEQASSPGESGNLQPESDMDDGEQDR